MSIRRKLGSPFGSACGLLVPAALVLAAPAATATADKPVPGGYYHYVKVLPRFEGWHGQKPPRNVVGVQVNGQGTRVDVGWTLWKGAGCVARIYGNPPHEIIDGRQLERIPVKADGSFHGVARPKGKYTKYDLVEANGKFVAGGDQVRFRIRHKFSGWKDAGNWERCDGRWLTFTACLSEHGKCVKAHPTPAAKPAPAPKPPPPPKPALPYQTGSYEGTTAQGEEIGFQVEKGLLGSVSFRASLQCSDGSSDTATAYVEEAPITGSHFDGEATETGDVVTIAGDLSKGGQASGTVRVTRDYPGYRSCDSGAVSFTARKT